MEIGNTKDMLANYDGIAISKAGNSLKKAMLLGFLAGMFISLGAVGSVTATAAAGSYFGRIVGAMVFPAGLIMVVLVGAELFTGNVLMLISVRCGKLKFSEMLRSWAVVYVANFCGALFVAAVMSFSGQFNGFDGEIARMTMVIASAKTGIPFLKAFLLGVLCNFLVCVGVWISLLGRRMIDKIAGMFFPIMLFVLCGFEHSIANMYFIPAGIFAKMNADYSGVLSGVCGIDGLDWTGFAGNIIPVTLGNIIGGALIFGLTLAAAHRVKE